MAFISSKQFLLLTAMLTLFVTLNHVQAGPTLSLPSSSQDQWDTLARTTGPGAQFLPSAMTDQDPSMPLSPFAPVSGMLTAHTFHCDRSTHIIATNPASGCQEIISRDQCLQTSFAYVGNDIQCEWDHGVCHPGCSCKYHHPHKGRGIFDQNSSKFICADRRIVSTYCTDIRERDVCLKSKISIGGNEVLCEWDSEQCHPGCSCGY